MADPVDLYDSAYAGTAERVYQEVRRDTYGVDLGQTGWMAAEDLESCGRLMLLKNGSKMLEIGCGAGGCAVHLASTVGVEITGIDMNERGIWQAKELAKAAGVSARARFLCIDASKQMPFEDCSLDAVFSNDAVCHIANRGRVFAEWYRVLRSAGRMLFTDAMILTGVLSNEEIATRSSIGIYFFLPPGENERLISEAGFSLLEARDTTQCPAEISKRWRQARARRQNELVRFEGETNFEGLQQFLSCVQKVSEERRLARYLYVAEKR
ncbi:MAG: methyltransferase domain-containing protein [Acidobacteriaceae bacterium]|nr:methyltransferase domain-containing protein [Acidobacteriaceae bacterium]